MARESGPEAGDDCCEPVARPDRLVASLDERPYRAINDNAESDRSNTASPRRGGARADDAGTLRLRSVVDIQTLDPANTFAVFEYNVNLAQLHGLIGWKKHLSWEWQPDAAASIEQVEDTHINFALRDDLGWTNGFGAMTAEDVKFSFERILDPALQSPYQADWALLDEAGVSGMSVTLTILNVTVWTTMAQVIQANLAEVGIEVEILVCDDGTFWTLGLESEGDAWKDIQMYLQLYSGLPDPSFQAQWFVPEQVGVWNWERWNSPEYGELNQLRLQEFDEETRAGHVRRMQELMEASGAYVFLTNGLAPILVRDDINPVLRPDSTSLYLAGFTRAG